MERGKEGKEVKRGTLERGEGYPAAVTRCNIHG